MPSGCLRSFRGKATGDGGMTTVSVLFFLLAASALSTLAGVLAWIADRGTS